MMKKRHLIRDTSAVKTSLFKWVACLLVGSQLAFAAEDAKLQTREQQISYVLGLVLAENIAPQAQQLDAAAFLLAIEDVLRQRDIRISDEKRKEVMKIMAQREKDHQEKMTTANREQGKTFLAKNKEQEGVITTASGLQYKILSQGDGPKPQPFSAVRVHYRGTLLDGTEFDSSYARGTPLDLSVGSVIQGWQEALMMMPTGSKWRIFVPPELAYGERGAGGLIGPNAVLLFDIELLQILDPATE